MAKKQIRINQSDIRRMIKEAVDSMGYPKVSGGAFSMDSPLGQEIKDHAQKHTEPGKNWLDREKWKDTWTSRYDGNDKRDRFAMDEFGDEKADSDRFDKPFGEFDDEIENQWDDEPGYADEPDDDEIAGIDEGRKIRMNDKQLREFVSYSVSRLLKEGWRPFYDKHGEWDGDEYTPYGGDSFVFEPDIEEYLNGADFPEYPEVRVEYTKTKGMKGDGYIQPDDPDEYTLDGWDIVNKESLPQEVIEAVKMYMENDFDLEDEAAAHEGYLEEAENRGITTHFDGKSSFKPKNPYEDMTWDEYREAKRKEREDDEEKKLLHDTNYPDEKNDRERNRGIMTHVPGKKDDSIKITQQDLAEMIEKAVCQLKESLSLPRYDAWKTRTPYDDEPSIISKDDFFENIAQDGDPGCRYNQCKKFLEWLADYDQEVYEKVMQENQATGENVFGLAMNNGIDWKEIARNFYDLTPVNYYKDDMYESAGKKI